MDVAVVVAVVDVDGAGVVAVDAVVLVAVGIAVDDNDNDRVSCIVCIKSSLDIPLSSWANFHISFVIFSCSSPTRTTALSAHSLASLGLLLSAWTSSLYPCQ